MTVWSAPSLSPPPQTITVSAPILNSHQFLSSTTKGQPALSLSYIWSCQSHCSHCQSRWVATTPAVVDGCLTQECFFNVFFFMCECVSWLSLSQWIAANVCLHSHVWQRLRRQHYFCFFHYFAVSYRSLQLIPSRLEIEVRRSGDHRWKVEGGSSTLKSDNSACRPPGLSQGWLENRIKYTVNPPSDVCIRRIWGKITFFIRPSSSTCQT